MPFLVSSGYNTEMLLLAFDFFPYRINIRIVELEVEINYSGHYIFMTFTGGYKDHENDV